MKRLTGSLAITVCAGILAWAPTIASADSHMKPPAEMEAWLKAAKLGAYAETPQNWAEIEKLAKQEGEVIIYSASSRMAKVAKTFNIDFPEIKVTSFDLGSVKSIEKTVREQDANLFNADLVTTGGSGQVIYELLNKHRIVNFVPDQYMDRIPAANRDPLLVRILEANVFMYNAEVYPTPPVKNVWEITEAKWKGKLTLKDPLASLSNFMGIATLVQNADAMAAAYKRHAGKDVELHEGVPNAGYEFLYRLLHNDPVILKSGSKAAAASGKKGQENPPLFFGPMTYYRYNFTKGYVNALAENLDPVAKLIYPTYVGIARQAPHPNAAKVFIRYLLGSTDLKADTMLAEPYNEGDSVKLLQGLAPYFDPGSKSPRDDVPLPKGGEAWNTMKAWTTDPEFMWREGPKVRDFWIQESGS
jgi:iron(III) transport system substrate-binding protein